MTEEIYREEKLDVTTELKSAYHPWVENYPDGIDWASPINTSPVTERVLETSAQYPDLIAMDFMGRRTDYRTLGQTIEKLSAALQNQLGVSKGTRVALLLPNIPFYAYFYYAVLRAGGVVVNSSPLYSVAELTQIISNSHADILVTLDLAQLFKKAEQVALETGLGRIVLCPFNQALPFPQNLLFPIAKRHDLARPGKSEVGDRVIRYGRLMRGAGSFTPVPIDAAHDIAVQQYTGGTTGVPKGAMLTHANISANASQAKYWAKQAYRPTRKLVAVIPFFHVFSMTTCLNNALVNGMELDMLPRFELKGVLDLIQRVKPHLIMAVPTLIHAVFSSESARKVDFSSFELGVSGGAPLSEQIRRRICRCIRRQTGRGLWSDRVFARGVLRPDLWRVQERLDRPTLPRHRYPLRRYRGSDQGGRPRRTRRNPGSRAPGHGRLFRGRGSHARRLCRRLAQNRRCRLYGFGRPRLPCRPHQGPDHFLGLQRLSALHRGSARIPSGRRGMQCHRACPTTIAARRRSPMSKLVPGAVANDKAFEILLVGKISRVETPREVIFRDELPKTLVANCPKRTCATTMRG